MDAMDSWKAQRTAQALDGLVNQQRMSARLAALEIALAFELRAHEATRRQLARANEQLEQIRSRTQRVATDGVMVCEVHGIEVWCHFETHEDGVTVTDVFVEPDQSIYDLMDPKDADHLAGQIADSLEAEARNA